MYALGVISVVNGESPARGPGLFFIYSSMLAGWVGDVCQICLACKWLGMMVLLFIFFGDPLDKVLRVARKARAGKGERRTVLGERFGVEVSGVLRDSSTSLRMTAI